MGVITYDQEVACSIPPTKLFKSFILDSDNLIPKVLPQAFKSIETLEGDGGPGTVKLITFGEGKNYSDYILNSQTISLNYFLNYYIDFKPT